MAYNEKECLKTNSQNQCKLLKILNEIFQLDQSDLDFGIYRIMNTKSKEINEFLDNDLLSSVAEAFSSNDNSSLQKELDDKVKSFRDDGFSEEQIEANPKIMVLREQLSSTTTSSNLENEVFSHLANFFKRYYKDGDFVSLRRYKKDTYAIPYEGEEVKLHWANSDQYYIKSGEYFRDYSFKEGEKTIHFKLSDAQTQSNNNKATGDNERRFVFVGCDALASPHELNINFEYKAVGKISQDKLNEESITKALEEITDAEFRRALSTLAPTQINKNRTIFEKHLKSYTSRNSFDYFIHKDLGGFLGRELDFYIKNEMLFLDDIMESPLKYDEVMSKVKIFKVVSSKIIAFLTQIEELQKKLWEKKKFVIETNYCITLDKIPQKYHEEIFTCKEQLAEWETLFGSEALASHERYLEAIKGGTEVPLPQEYRYLVVDTKFFDTKFKYKLLSEFDNLDEQMDGVLINSENFGALNLLQERYREQVKTVYIDPPYNTGNDGFLYADSFQHSSWMSFMFDRLALGRELMSDDGVIFSSIDEHEQHNLRNLKNLVFNEENLISELIWSLNSGTQAGYFTRSHENILSYAKNNIYLSSFKDFSGGTIKHGALKKISKVNPSSDLLFPKGKIKCEENNITFTGVVGGSEQQIIKGSMTFVDGILSEDIIIEAGWAMKNQVLSWLDGKETYDSKGQKVIRFYFNSQGILFYEKERGTQHPKTVLQSEIVGNTRKGGQDILDLFSKKMLNFPKPVNLIKFLVSLIAQNKADIILDFFAGSGTTGHAVINLNREDNGKRKYILVEMGEYFDSVTKPRIQKVIYSDSYKDGKPTTQNGISQIFKYFKLESYEDTLNNLKFTKTKEQKNLLDNNPEVKEDYLLNYSLHVESQKSLLNIESFKTPFDYKLRIATSSVGETKETNIDLVETFNYLLGLKVEQTKMENGYLWVSGRNLKNEKILIIWRDLEKVEKPLEEFVKRWDIEKKDDIDFDFVYINGDNNLQNIKKEEALFKVKLIEQEFQKLMFHE